MNLMMILSSSKAKHRLLCITNTLIACLSRLETGQTTNKVVLPKETLEYTLDILALFFQCISTLYCKVEMCRSRIVVPNTNLSHIK